MNDDDDDFFRLDVDIVIAVFAIVCLVVAVGWCV